MQRSYRFLFASSFLFALAGLGASLYCAPLKANPSSILSLQKQRVEILQAGSKGTSALPLLTEALKNPNPIIRRAAARSLGQIGEPAQALLASISKEDKDALTRRTAVHSLGQIGKPAQALLEDALKNDADALTRRTALQILVELAGKDTVKVISPALQDSDELVRATAVQTLTGMKPFTAEITALLKKAQQDSSSNVSRIAAQALWPFHKQGVSFQQLPANQDQQLVVSQTIPLLKEGWKFHLDPDQNGHEADWFKPDFDDSKWQNIKIEEAWESQIGEEYDGIAWYRLSFTLPEKLDQKGTDIVFNGVDESAWIWINGEYIGDHDIGPSGWDKQFAIDATDPLKWNAENQITIRVLDRKQAGGIWKPVYLEVLK